MSLPLPARRILLALLFGTAAGWARAQTAVTDVGDFITYMDGYNLVALSSATFGTTAETVGGGIAVQTSLSISGSWTFDNSNTPSNGISLLFSGTGSSLSISSGSTVKVEGTGNVSAESLKTSDYSWSSPSLTETREGKLTVSASSPSDPLTTAAPSGWSWSTEGTDLDNLSGSSGLGGLTETTGASVAVSGGVLEFTAPSSQTSGVVVFTLDVGSGGLNSTGNSYDGTSFTSISIENYQAGVNYVINVVGLATGDTLFENVTDNFTEADQILWNLESTSAIDATIDTSSEFYGSILAPEVDLTDSASSAVLDGQVAANDISLSNTSLDFAAEVLVPEPRTYALWAVALCGAGAIWLARRRRGMLAR